MIGPRDYKGAQTYGISADIGGIFDPANERVFISYQESPTRLLARMLESIARSKGEHLGRASHWRALYMLLLVVCLLKR